MMAKVLFIMIAVTFSISTNTILAQNTKDKTCDVIADPHCVNPNLVQDGYYINQWSVNMPDTTKDDAERILENLGFDYLGQITVGDLHIVTRKDTPGKYEQPDEYLIGLLKNLKNVDAVWQIHILPSSKDDGFEIVNEHDIECLQIDPDTIKLNDGSENLARLETPSQFVYRPTSYSYNPNPGTGQTTYKPKPPKKGV